MDKLAKDFNQNFIYADIIAERMAILYKNTSDIQHKTTALRIILKISVAANRYVAMSVFNDILGSITDSNEGTAISLMLKYEINEYSKLLQRARVTIPMNELHFSLRDIRRLAEDFNSI